MRHCTVLDYIFLQLNYVYVHLCHVTTANNQKKTPLCSEQLQVTIHTFEGYFSKPIGQILDE